MVVVAYGTAIQEAMAKGDLQEMLAIGRHARKLIAEQGDLVSAYDELLREIGRAVVEGRMGQSEGSAPE